MLRCCTVCCGVQDGASPREKILLTSQWYSEVSATSFWLVPWYFGQHAYIMCRFIGQFEL